VTLLQMAGPRRGCDFRKHLPSKTSGSNQHVEIGCAGAQIEMSQPSLSRSPKLHPIVMHTRSRWQTQSCR
jgi:hypothetical protein